MIGVDPLSTSRKKLNIWRICGFIIIVLVGVTWFTIYTHHMQLINKQQMSSLEFTASTVLKPLYYLQCPTFNTESIGGCEMPRVFMISARSQSKRLEIEKSWERAGVEVIDTLSTSLRLRKSTAAICKSTSSMKGSLLFSVYQHVFQLVLQKYDYSDNSAESGYIFVEDDAELIDYDRLRMEVCSTMKYNYQFYSFFRTNEQKEYTFRDLFPFRKDVNKRQGDGTEFSCIYQYGFVAFYINKALMKRIIHADVETSCRQPVDLYIAARGPWFSTTHPIVIHRGTRSVNLSEKQVFRGI